MIVTRSKRRSRAASDRANSSMRPSKPGMPASLMARQLSAEGSTPNTSAA